MSEQNQTSYIALQVKGMTCTNCALGIEKYLEKEGLAHVNVDFSNGEVNFATASPENLNSWVKGIENLGFEVVQDEEGGEEGWSRVEKYFAISLVFTLPLILHMFISWHVLHNPWVQFGLSLPVFILGMLYFGRSAWSSIKAGVPNMDVLISIGAIAAFGYSLYGAINQLGPDFLFFETAASVITLVLLGNVIEHRSVKRTTAAVRNLQDMQAKTAPVLTAEGKLIDTPLEHVQKGMELLLSEGSIIPLDVRVLEGEGHLDESMITGESQALLKEVGDQLMSGTLLQHGQLKVVVEKEAKDSTLSQMIQLVKKAQADKPDIQRLADRISAIFVPAVLAISLITFLLAYIVFGLPFTQSMLQAIAVLVIACPCAMGLATPTAVVVGLGRASKKGILIKGGSVFEKATKIDTVVFDKTGTLTTGEFQLKEIHVVEVGQEETVKSVVASMEQYSSHPIALSLRNIFSEAKPVELQQVKEQKGLGMTAQDKEGNTYQIGSFRTVKGMLSEDQYSVYVLKNGEFWAGISLKDDIRIEAKETISWLSTQGIRTIMLSGDKKGKCEDVAHSLGIDEVYSEQLPEQKLQLLSNFMERGHVMMVGDGINDAPALAKAHIGVSLSGASDIAQEAAEVVLMSQKMDSLKDLFNLSKHTVLTIKQNLFWAFFYNVIMIPAAAIGLLRPILAAFSMAFSDIFVIGNSLRLRVKNI
ncbi:MAG: cation-translocating P-type ATPase [Bacteroidota bacterium]